MIEIPHSPQPVKNSKILKKDKQELRNIFIPCQEDRSYQRKILLPQLENQIDPYLSSNSFAYRKSISTYKTVEYFNTLVNDGFYWVIKLDIEKYYDSIDRAILYKTLSGILPSYLLEEVKQSLEVPYIYKNKLYPKNKGIYQGMPISPILSNLYLTELDRAFTHNNKVATIRYSDDILILSTSKKKLIEALRKIKRILRKLKLKWEQSESINLNTADIVFVGWRFAIEEGRLVVRASRRAETSLIEALPIKITDEEITKCVRGKIYYYTVGLRYSDFYLVAKDIVTKMKGGDTWNRLVSNGLIPSMVL